MVIWNYGGAGSNAEQFIVIIMLISYYQWKMIVSANSIFYIELDAVWVSANSIFYIELDAVWSEMLSLSGENLRISLMFFEIILIYRRKSCIYQLREKFII